MSDLEPLPPSDGFGEGFRVADVRAGGRGFMDSLAAYLTQYSAGAALPADPAAGLSLPTLEEAVQLAPEPEPADAPKEDIPASQPTMTTRRGARAAEDAAAAAPPPPPPPEGAAKPAAKPAAKGRKRKPSAAAAAAEAVARAQLQKAAAIEERAAAVDAVRRRLHRDRAAAAQHLRTLAVADADAPRLANRSFGAAYAPPELHRPPPITPAAPLPAQSGDQDGEAVAEGEVVVRLAVHLPQSPAHVGEEWLVLGSQRLVELRDAVHCLCEDNVAAVEREENQRRATAGAPPLALAKRDAYLYLEGTFYVDSRAEGARDLSEGVREYLKAAEVAAPPHPHPGPAARALGPLTTQFSVARMEERAFEDVWVRLGPSAPGLYCHQGGCEHLVTVRDVRAHDPRVDPPRRGQYPFRLAFPEASLVHKRKCEACGVRLAGKVTHGDPAAPATPFFWCAECFLQMHYDAEGRALFTNYKVFPYQADFASLANQDQRAG